MNPFVPLDEPLKFALETFPSVSPHVDERLARLRETEITVWSRDSAALRDGVRPLAIGFVTVAYDSLRLDYLAQSVNSVAEQTDKRLSLVIIDNGTTGEVLEYVDSLRAVGTADVVVRVPENRFDPRKYDKNPLIDLWNLGAILSPTRFFFPLSWDDWISPNYVSEMLCLLSQNDCLAAAPLAVPVLEDGTVNRAYADRIESGNTQSRMTPGRDVLKTRIGLSDARVFAAPGDLLCVDTATLLGNGGYDDMSDVSLFIKVGMHGNVGYSPEARLYWRNHGQQANRVQKAQGIIYFRTYATFPSRYGVEALVRDAGAPELARVIPGAFREMAESVSRSSVQGSFKRGLVPGLRATLGVLSQARPGEAMRILRYVRTNSLIRRETRKSLRRLRTDPKRIIPHSARKIGGSSIRRILRPFLS